jgi:hypothetical protein
MARQLPMILLASLNFRSTFSQLSQRKVFVYREGMICQLCFMLRIAASLQFSIYSQFHPDSIFQGDPFLRCVYYVLA